MINLKHKFIFVHVPRTGGVSIEKYFGQPWQNHATLQTYIDSSPLRAKDYFKFVFVRNPWDRLVSWYFHMNPKTPVKSFDYKIEGGSRCRKENGTWREIGKVGEKLVNFKEYYEPDFRSWIKKGNPHHWKKNCGTNWAKKDPLSCQDWLMNSKNIDFDFIGKFETLQEDFSVICERIGVPNKKLSHLNKSKHRHYTEYYDEETQEIIAKKYKKDIEMFGYKFGED